MQRAPAFPNMLSRVCGLSFCLPFPDVILQARITTLLELERRKREEEAARKAEELRFAAEEAKRNYACLLLSKEVRLCCVFTVASPVILSRYGTKPFLCNKIGPL